MKSEHLYTCCAAHGPSHMWSRLFSSVKRCLPLAIASPCHTPSHPSPPHDDNDEVGDNNNDTTSQDNNNNNNNNDATSQDNNNNNNNNNVSSGWRGGRIWTGSGPKRASFGPGTFFFLSFIDFTNSIYYLRVNRFTDPPSLQERVGGPFYDS
jgi:hypothetical protein